MRWIGGFLVGLFAVGEWQMYVRYPEPSMAPMWMLTVGVGLMFVVLPLGVLLLL